MNERRGHAKKGRPTQLGDYLTALRIQQGLTLRQAGEAVNVSAGYLCQIERGKKSPPAHVLRALAGRYGVLPKEVLKKVGLLELPFVAAILQAADQTTSALDVLRGVLDEGELQELTYYLAFIRAKRFVNPSSPGSHQTHP